MSKKLAKKLRREYAHEFTEARRQAQLDIEKAKDLPFWERVKVCWQILKPEKDKYEN